MGREVGQEKMKYLKSTSYLGLAVSWIFVSFSPVLEFLKVSGLDLQ